VAATLEMLQAAQAATAARPAQSLQLVAQAAAESIVIDEADTRVLIDTQLVTAGWQADSTKLRYASGARPLPGQSMAIAEWPTDSGPVDYALFLDSQCVGVIKAKRGARDVPAVLKQAKRYARDICLEADQVWPGAPYRHDPKTAYRVPFAFAANGRPFGKLRTSTIKSVPRGRQRASGDDQGPLRAAPGGLMHLPSPLPIS
jgi:type I restriction enzyme, R subunit